MGKNIPHTRRAAGERPQDTAGSVPIPTVKVREYGNRAMHRTEITLINVPLPLVSVTTGAGVGGVTIYTMPAGRIAFMGGMANLSIAIAAADQEDFTDNTPEGQLGVGTLAPANADALGTDATDDNLCTAADFTMTAFADASVICASEASGQQFDGTSTAMNVVLTGLVDAGDIDDGVTTQALVSGTIVLHWINLGDV